MMFDEKINYCILHNNPDENFINKLGSIPVVKDLEFNKLVERLEFFPNKQVIFNETLYGLKLDEKMKIFKLLKKQNISYINVTSNVEDALYSDYIFVYDGNKLVLEGNRNEVLNKFCKIDSSFVSVNIYTINNNQIILKENQKNDNVEKIQYLLDIYNNINKTL